MIGASEFDEAMENATALSRDAAVVPKMYLNGLSVVQAAAASAVATLSGSEGS